MYIGPAGENMVRNACVMTKMCHAAGYGGYGSLMGSKNLKAVACKSRGSFPGVDQPTSVKLMWDRAHKDLMKVSQFRRWAQAG